MNHCRLTLFIDGLNDASVRQSDEDNIARLMLYSKAQAALIEAITELHDLADQVVVFKTSESITSTIIAADLPTLMANVLDCKERAKRLYRASLHSRICGCSLDFEELYDDLEQEILRTNEILSLYARRGNYY